MPQSEIKNLLEESKQHYFFSGAQLYAEKGTKKLQLEIGETSYWKGATRVLPDTRFDIGSITKVLSPTSVFARVPSLASEFTAFLARTPYAHLTLSDVLTHTAGFLSWYPLYKEASSASVLDWYMKNASKVLVEKPGKKVIYSDLGFILFGEVIKKLWGSIDVGFEKEVVRPLGLEGVSYGPLNPTHVASTEYDRERKTPLTGIVFDENAQMLGGKAPHAGVFSSARSLAPWCREWLNALKGKSRWISEETATRFTTCSTPKHEAPRALGFDMKSLMGSSAGTKMSEKTFGHLGYTGCSVWVDPEKDLFVIFLSNRVHPSRVDERIRCLRPLLHDKVVDYLESA